MIWLLPLLGFFLGSIPFGLLLGKMKGIDVRKHGSGNIGTTNVFRVLGKGPGIVCLVLDFLKGYLPVLLAQHFTADILEDQRTLAQSIVVITAFAAIMGHNYCPWLGFKGGKGIATSGGAIVALMPVGALLLIIVWAIFTFSSKYVSVGSIAAAIALPLLCLYGSWHHGKLQDGTWNKPLFIFSLIAGSLAVYKHRGNITRLREGTENKIGQKKNS